MKLQREQEAENDKLRRECEDLKESFTSRLERDYIRIEKHEQLINDQLKQVNDKFQEQLKKIKERFEGEIARRLEEKERVHSEG